MNKKFCLLIFLFLLAFPLKIKADNVKVFINGNSIQDSDSAFIINGRTMLPMRSIFETLGCSVEWNDEKKEITAIRLSQKDYLICRISLSSNTLTVESFDFKSMKSKDLYVKDLSQSPPVIINGRTFVPSRFIAEALSAQVDWNDKTKTVFINSDFYNSSWLPQELNDNEEYLVNIFLSNFVELNINDFTPDVEIKEQIAYSIMHVIMNNFKLLNQSQSSYSLDKEIINTTIKRFFNVENYAHKSFVLDSDKWSNIWGSKSEKISFNGSSYAFKHIPDVNYGNNSSNRCANLATLFYNKDLDLYYAVFNVFSGNLTKGDFLYQPSYKDKINQYIKEDPQAYFITNGADAVIKKITENGVSRYILIKLHVPN